MSNPLFVVENYVFSNLRNDAIRVENGSLQRGLLSISCSDSSDTVNLLPRMQFSWKFAEMPEEEQPAHMGEESGSYLQWMVKYICEHRLEVKLLLCRAEGTSYEQFVHTMVEVEVDATLRYMDVLRRQGQHVPPVDRELCHILASGMFNGIFEVVVHDMPYEQAARCVGQLREFYTAGWMKLMEP